MSSAPVPSTVRERKTDQSKKGTGARYRSFRPKQMRRTTPITSMAMLPALPQPWPK